MRLLSLFLIIGLLAACGETTTTEGEATSTDNKIADQKTVAKRLQPQQFEQLLAKTPDAQLIDVRTPGEYGGGTIGNAVNIDFRSPDFAQRIGKLDKDQPVFLFCQSGGRSGQALKQMQEMGFTTLYELSVGYGGWEQLKSQPQLDPNPVEQ